MSARKGVANGGIDVVGTTNHPPTITDLILRESKFLLTCDCFTAIAEATDPEGDQVAFSWSLVSTPAGAQCDFIPSDDPLHFKSHTAGTYQAKVTACDVTPKPDGGRARFVDDAILRRSDESRDPAAFGAFRDVAHDEEGLVECGGLLLDAARVGEDRDSSPATSSRPSGATPATATAAPACSRGSTVMGSASASGRRSRSASGICRDGAKASAAARVNRRARSMHARGVMRRPLPARANELHARDAVRIPGMISFVRVVLAAIVPFVVERAGVAVAVLAGAGLSDILDGWVARRRGEETAMGAVLDGVADKVFVASMLVTLVVRGRLGALDVVLLSTREIVEAPIVAWGVLRRAPLERERRASAAGKLTTSLQFVTLVLVVVHVRHTAPMIGAAASGLVAGFAYAMRERRTATVQR